MSTINWICKPFYELNPTELYAILQLRNEVFVVEQNCVFQDADNKDQQSFHLAGYVNDDVAAYARLVPSGVAYNEPSIGRVVTSPAYRRIAAGKQLMQKAIAECYQLFGKQTIKIGAQLYLKKFYESFGFRQMGEEYDEDGIIHIYMIL